MRIALLTNFIPPYRLPLYSEMVNRCAAFRVFLSARTEAGRAWVPEWGEVPVELQRTVSFQSDWRHPHKFAEPLTIHFPYDTLPQLFHFHPDVIVSCEMGMRTLQAAVYRRCFQNTRLVLWATLSEVTEEGRGRLRHHLRNSLLRIADAVIVNGASGARYVQRFGVEADRLFFVPYTTDLDPFLDLQAARNSGVRRRLLYSGALTERKGILPFLAHLADWAERHSDRSVEFYIAGDGPLRPILAAFRAPPNLDLRLLGHVPYEHLPEVYGNAGILAFPTLADEWGLVVTEAMASGIPVLGSCYSQAVEELVRDGENGWTYRPDHAPEVSNALHRALETPLQKLNEMAESARAKVCNLTPSTMADRIMTAIEYALKATS
jgi:glycosyltransferase involved in cell wall biosynthesis